MSKENRKTAKATDFVLPPHSNAKAHEKVMTMLKTMTPQQVFELAVEAGIYTSDGKLTEHYQPVPE